MSKKILSFLIVGSLVAVQLLGAVVMMEKVYAVGGVPDADGRCPGGGVPDASNRCPGGVPDDSSFKLPNPLASDSLCGLLTAALDLLVELAAIVAVVMIIWVGLRFIRAQGDPKAIQDAKSAFLNTILGTGILLGASVIAKIIVNTILSVTDSTGSTSTC